MQLMSSSEKVMVNSFCRASWEMCRQWEMSRQRSWLQFFTTVMANSPESCEQWERESFWSEERRIRIRGEGRGRAIRRTETRT